MANIPLLATIATLKAQGPETASTTGAVVVLGGPSSHIAAGPGFWLATVALTAMSGTTPSLLVVLEGSQNGGGTWQELAVIGADGVRTWGMTALPSAFTAPTTVQAPCPAQSAHLRYRSIIGGGTPSVTYSVVVQFFMNPDHA